MFSAGFSRDTRDSAINPTRGQLISADHSVAARIFGGTESFNKFFATYQQYKTLDQFTPLLGDSTLAFSARVGLASTFNASDRNMDGVIDANGSSQAARRRCADSGSKRQARKSSSNRRRGRRTVATTLRRRRANLAYCRRCSRSEATRWAYSTSNCAIH
jgi:hypothetical protein